MNRELKKQVNTHGHQLNNLFVRVSKIEDKFMRENYEVRAVCPNCLKHNFLTIPVGEKRPKTYFCENCKCEVEPTSFGW